MQKILTRVHQTRNFTTLRRSCEEGCCYNSPNFREVNKMKKLILLVSVGLLLTAAVFADIPRPDNSKVKQNASFETTLDIRLRADEKDARLIIPKSQIKQLRAQLEAIDNGSENTSALTSSNLSGTQTIVSGLFLSLAIVIGGMWFVRSNGSNSTANKGVIAAVLLLCIASASFVFANAGPPAEARSITGKMFSPAMHIYGFGWGKIKVETTDDNDRITLIVPNPKTTSSPGEE